MKMSYFSRVSAVLKVNSIRFLLVFFTIFTISYAFLVFIDFVPEPISEDEETSTSSFVEQVQATFDPFSAVNDNTADSIVASLREDPVILTIPSLSRSVKVVPAVSNSLADLDTALLSGVVRHPDSALLGEEGNVVILGHSSYLPNVLNRNFQALNGTQNLEWGDSLVVLSDTTRYTYIVRKVYKVKASDYVIATDGAGKRLTLVTCNSFATADDRYIIEAEFLISEPIA